MNAGSGQLAIGVSLLMRDGFTSQATLARNAMNNLYNSGDRLARQQAVLARNTNAAGAAIGVGMIAGMSKMYKEGADFNYLMKYVSLNADKTGKSFDSLSAKALEVGKRTMFSSMDIADGMKWMAQAGMDAEQIKASIDSAADLAQATMSNLAGESGTADLMNRVAAAFKIPLNESNTKRIVDVLGMAANDSATDLVELGETMKYSQATAARLGMTLEETAAAAMVLANSGLRGSMGGTAFENMMRELAKASSGASPKKNKALGMLGMSVDDIKDANGNLRPMANILERIGKGLKGMGTADKQNVVTDLLNVRAARATDLADNLIQYRSFIDDLNNNSGYTQKMGGDMMDTDKGKIDILKSNWEALRIQIGGILSTIFTPAVRIFTKVVDALSGLLNTNSGKFIGAVIGGFIVIRTVGMAYRAVLLSVKILQMDMGTTMASTGSQTVSWYNRMTASANAYAGAAGRAKGGMMGMIGFGGGAGGAGTVMKNSQGKWVQVMPGGMHRYLPKGSGKVAMHKANQFAGKASPWAMLGGMAISSAGDSMGDTTGGKIMSGAGDAIAMAGTGAMIGSMIPVIGTAAGALVGGIGSLIYTLYNNLNEANSEVAKANNKASFNEERWRKQANIYMGLNWKQKAYLDYGETNINGERVRRKDGSNVQHEGQRTSTTVILQVDGLEKSRNTYNDFYTKELINLGF